MRSPAAREEISKVARQHSEHRFLRSHTHTHLQHGRTDFLAQLDSGLEKSLRGQPETRTAAARRSKQERKMLKEHARAVREELRDVMTRASDTMRERIRNGAPGGMYVSAFLTPMQQKLRAGQLAYEREAGIASAHYDYGGPNGSSRMPTHAAGTAHAETHMVSSWSGSAGRDKGIVLALGEKNVSGGAMSGGGDVREKGSTPSVNEGKSSRSGLAEAIDSLSDVDLGGGPAALQCLALQDPHKFGKRLRKVLRASTMMHADAQTSLQAICELCEDRSLWLAQAERARLFVYEPEALVSPGEDLVLSKSRVVCFRRDGQKGTLDLNGESTTNRSDSSSGIHFAFAGLLPKHGRMHNKLYDGIVEAAESGQPVSLYLDKRTKRRKKRKRDAKKAKGIGAENALSWCFPILDHVGSGKGLGNSRSASRTVGILVVTNARNRTLEHGAVKTILSYQQNGKNEDALSIHDIDGVDSSGMTNQISLSSSSSSSSPSSFSSGTDDSGYSGRNERASGSRHGHRRGDSISFSDNEIVFSQFLQNVALALNNVRAKDNLVSQYRLQLDLEVTKQSDAQAHANDQAKRIQQEANDQAAKLQHETSTIIERLQAEAEAKAAEFQIELARLQVDAEEAAKEKEKLRLELEKAQYRIAEDEKLIKMREEELINFDAEREVEAAKQLMQQKAEEEAVAAEKARLEAEMAKLKEEHSVLLKREQNEHKALQEMEAALAEAKSGLERQQRSQEKELSRLNKDMARKYEREMETQKAELEAEVRKHEAELRRQKKRAESARAAAARSKDRLPSALGALRRMSQIAMGQDGGHVEEDGNNLEEDHKTRAAELLQAIVETTISILEAERATLFLVSEDGTQLWSEHTADAYAPAASPPPSPSRAADSQIAPVKPAFRIVVDRTSGICGHVATTRHLYNIADVYDDVRFDSSWDKKTGFRTRSMLVAPVLNAKGDVLGVIQAMNKIQFESDFEDPQVDGDAKPKHPVFKTEDEQIIRMLCSHAAMGIEHSQGLHQDAEALSSAKKALEATQEQLTRHDNEAAMLLDAAQDVALSSAECYNQIDSLLMQDDFDEEDAAASPKLRSMMVPMFERVVAHARRLCKADRASLFFADWEGHRLWSVVAEGVTTASSTSKQHRNATQKLSGVASSSSAVIELPMGRGVVGRCVETGEPVVTHDARTLPYFDDTHDMVSGYHTKSIICMPIFGQKAVDAGLASRNVSGKRRRNKKSESSKHNGNKVVVAALMIINKLDEKGIGCTTNAFKEHDVELARSLSAQVSGPVLHAQDLMKTIQGRRGMSQKMQKEMMKKIANVEKEGALALQAIESELKSKVHDVSSRASRMMAVLEHANQNLFPGVVDHGNDSRSVSTLLSHVLDEVRSVLGALSIIFHEQDIERRLLWPRARSQSDKKMDDRDVSAILGKYGLSAGHGGTTPLTSASGGNVANASVAVTVAASNSAVGLETKRRACALSGEKQFHKLSTNGESLHAICLPVHGRNEIGGEIVLGVLEAIVPSRHVDTTGSDEMTSDHHFLASISAQVGAVLGEEIQAKTRAAGEEQAARALKQLQDQLASVKKEEAAIGARLDKEERLMVASAALNKKTMVRSGKHGALVDLFGRTVSSATSLLGADRGSLFLVDFDNGMLRTTDTSKSTEKGALVDDDTPVNFIEIPIKKSSIAGSVALSGDESNIPDAYKDPRFNSNIDRKSGYRTQSMLTVPIFGHRALPEIDSKNGKSGNKKKKRHKEAATVKRNRRLSFSRDDGMQVIAILQLINKIGPTDGSNKSRSPFIPFTGADSKLAQRFVEQVSPAIRNALAADAQAEEVASAHAHLRELEEQIDREHREAKQREVALAEEKEADKREAEKVLQVVVEKNAKLEKSLIALRAESHRLRDREKDLEAQCKNLELEMDRLRDANAKSVTQIERSNAMKIKELRDVHRKRLSDLETLHSAECEKLEREHYDLMESHKKQRRQAKEQLLEYQQQLEQQKEAMRSSHEVERMKQNAQKELANATASIEELRKANGDLLAKVALLEARRVGPEHIYAGPSGLSSMKRKEKGRPKPDWTLSDGDYAISDAGSERSTTRDSRMRRRKKKGTTKKKSKNRDLAKGTKKHSKSMVVTLKSASPSRRGNVLLNFGVKNPKSGKVQNYAVSASKAKKIVKKKKKKKLLKKKAVATLSTGEKGRVTIVVDKRLFTTESELGSSKRKRVVRHPTPPRASVDRSPKLYSSDVSRLEYGFAPPPTSR
eukprot:g2454.t1